MPSTVNREELCMLAGPVLHAYLDDPVITEIDVNPNGSCFLHRFGKPKAEDACPDPADLDRFLRVVAHHQKQTWREATPTLHASLAEIGWRIQASRPPQAPGLQMALRKHPRDVFPLEDYVAKGIMTQEQVDILRAAIRAGKRILIGGETGSAKTSVLNAALHSLGASLMAMCIIQDDPEVISTVRDCRWLSVRPGVTLGDLVVESLRYTPDLIVVGEVREGTAAYAMCEAFNTGHGGISTIHVKSAPDTVLRLNTLMKRVNGTDEYDLIHAAIDMVVHLTRHDGVRRCTGIVTPDGHRLDTEEAVGARAA